MIRTKTLRTIELERKERRLRKFRRDTQAVRRKQKIENAVCGILPRIEIDRAGFSFIAVFVSAILIGLLIGHFFPETSGTLKSEAAVDQHMGIRGY